MKLSNKAEIEVPEIGNPLLPNIWRETNIMTFAYGHGIAISPLQFVNAFTSIINGGNFRYATLIKEKYLNIIPYFNFNFKEKYILSVEDLQNSFIFVTISFFIIWSFKNSISFAQIKNDKLIFPQLENFKVNFLGVYFVYIMFFYCLISLTNIDFFCHLRI